MQTKTINHTDYQKRLRKLSIEALRYIVKDVRETLEAWPNHPNGGYYLDEIIYCEQELRRRDGTRTRS